MWWVYHFSPGSHCLQPPHGFSKDKQAFTPLSQFLPWDLPQRLMKKGIDSTHERLHKAQWLWLVPEWAAQDGAGCLGQTAWGPSHQDAAGLSVHIAHSSGPTLAPHEGAEASEGSSPLCRISDQPAAAVCGGPSAAAAQGFHTGLGHHHLKAGETHARQLYSYTWPAEEGTGWYYAVEWLQRACKTTTSKPFLIVLHGHFVAHLLASVPYPRTFYSLVANLDLNSSIF